MDVDALAHHGYQLTPAQLPFLGFHTATRFADLVFTSGQIPVMDDVAIKGKVGRDVDLQTAMKAAEICAINALRAALAVAECNEIERVVKVFGMVNVADGFNDTSGVINGATDILNTAFPGQPSHARSAVGVVLPGDWAVEVELILALRK